jgi:hypothetical protein
MSVSCYGYRPAIWSCMEGSDMDTRATALEDVNALLYNSYTNSSTLATLDGWQSWLYALLVDVPKQKEKVHKSVYAYTLNVFSNIHAEYFFKSKVYHNFPFLLLILVTDLCCNKDFADLLWQSLQRLHALAGFTDESRHIASVVLYSMTNKVKSQVQMFSQVFSLFLPSNSFNSCVNFPCFWLTSRIMQHLNG